MKKIYFLVVGFLLIGSVASAQYTRYIIQFTGKNNSPYSLQRPTEFLSAKALQRRTRQNISLDSTDLPINPAYLDSIRNAGAVTLLTASKWLNQVAIQTTDSAALAHIMALPFVRASASGPIAVRRNLTPGNARNKFTEDMQDITVTYNRSGDTVDYFNYGNSDAQVRIHHGEFLHNNGFRGEGMTIAILDAGFRAYLTNPAFDSARNQGQILGTWDFVKNEASVNEDDTHGMYCFSIIAANLPGVMVGTCPKAKFYLFRTEDAATEYPIEEQNWVAGAERADSLGVDLITSSLGYSEFDDPVFNHTYADMNGNTTIITRGADFAAKKGMIVTNSAGNSGQDPWHYLIAPSDGDSVLAVGAVNTLKNVAPFSSYGPSSDGRIKPNVASVGWGTIVTNTVGTPVGGNGTSFSNPNLAGLITCLWQAFPEFSNMEILDAVQKSADHFSNPDDRVGYGIPDFQMAYNVLLQKRGAHGNIWAYPVPFTDQFTVSLVPTNSGKSSLSLVDASGRTLLSKSFDAQAQQFQAIPFHVKSSLPHGTYYLVWREGKTRHVLPILK